MNAEIRHRREDGETIPYLTCPKCGHEFTSWDTILTGGFIKQTGFIDTYRSTYDGKEVYVKGDEGLEMDGSWNADHYCERCNYDITAFIDEVFDGEWDSL